MDFSSKSISSFISSAGPKSRGSLISSAQLIASGITQAGDLIKTHTSETEDPNQKIGLLSDVQSVSSTTSSVLSTTHNYIGQGAHKVIEAAEAAEKRFDSNSESETMKKIKSNQGVQATVCVGKAVGFAGLEILSGVTEGIQIIKEAGVDTTSGVVQHKLGNEAGQITREGFSIAGDFAGIYALASIGELAGVSASGVMEIKDEQIKLKIIFTYLTRCSI